MKAKIPSPAAVRIHALTAVIASALPLGAFAQNLITNGSFEDGPNPGYTITTTPSTTPIPYWTAYTLSGTTNIAYNGGGGTGFPNSIDGSRHLSINSSDSTPGLLWIHQDFTTTPSVTYQVVFYMGSLGTTGAGTVSVKAEVRNTGDLSLLGTLTSSTTAPFGSFLPASTFTFTATGPTSRLLFNDLSTITSSVDLALDHVQVSAIPEPSTYAALAGAAMLGLAVGRSRMRNEHRRTAGS